MAMWRLDGLPTLDAATEFPRGDSMFLQPFHSLSLSSYPVCNIPHLMCQTNQLLRKMQLAKIVYLAAMKLLPLAAIIHQLKLSVNTIGLSNCTFTMDGHRHKELIVYAICSHLQIMILL